MSCDCNSSEHSMSDKTPCECEPDSFPFQCPRHRDCLKNEHFVALCKTNMVYYQGWENGTAPCIPAGDFVPSNIVGLGDVIAWILSRLGIKQWAGCRCKARRAFLNRIQLWPIRWPQ